MRLVFGSHEANSVLEADRRLALVQDESVQSAIHQLDEDIDAYEAEIASLEGQLQDMHRLLHDARRRRDELLSGRVSHVRAWGTK
jgi:flagellar biosynthesis chaperone FliJ